MEAEGTAAVATLAGCATGSAGAVFAVGITRAAEATTAGAACLTVTGRDGAAVAAAAAAAAAGAAGIAGAVGAAGAFGAAGTFVTRGAVASCPTGPNSGLRGFMLSRGRPSASHCLVAVAVVGAIVLVELLLGCSEDTRLEVGDDTCSCFAVVVVVAGAGAATFVTMAAAAGDATTPAAGAVSVVDACLGSSTNLHRPSITWNAALEFAGGTCSAVESDLGFAGGTFSAGKTDFAFGFVQPPGVLSPFLAPAIRNGTRFLCGGVRIPLHLCRLPGSRSFKISITSVQFATAV